MIFNPGRVDCIFPGKPEYECRKLRRPTEADCAECAHPRPSPEVFEAWQVYESLVSQGVQHLKLGEYVLERFYPDLGETTFIMTMIIFDMAVEKAERDAKRRHG